MDEDETAHEADIVTERGGHDTYPPGGGAESFPRDGLSGRPEEPLPLAEGDAPTDDDEIRVEDVDPAHARGGERPAGLFHDLVSRGDADVLGLRDVAGIELVRSEPPGEVRKLGAPARLDRPPGLARDGHARGEGLEVTDATATAWRPMEVDREVPEFAGRPVGSVHALNAVQRGPSGRVITLEIVTDSGTVTASRGGIRAALRYINSSGTRANLPSALFFVEPVDGDSGTPTAFRVHGGGFGHGTGMAQVGAVLMARNGKLHPEILRHYYRGAELRKLY